VGETKTHSIWVRTIRRDLNERANALLQVAATAEVGFGLRY
jgi:hypothetical protein